jgi:hypothetical protein
MEKTCKFRYHIVMRVGSEFFNNSNSNLIEEHNKICNEFSFVFFGKSGKVMSENKINLIKDQANSKNGILFILVKRDGPVLKVFTAPLYEIKSLKKSMPELKYVPKYYHDVVSKITTWFKIGHIKVSNINFIESLNVVSSDTPILKVLASCRTSLMLVKETAKVLR